jgi:hypothetical protein
MKTIPFTEEKTMTQQNLYVSPKIEMLVMDNFCDVGGEYYADMEDPEEPSGSRYGF